MEKRAKLKPTHRRRRTVCFVTGTRAEFGLMRSTLTAMAAHPELELQIIATGMHLDPSRGKSIDEIVAAGFKVHCIVPWGAEGDGSQTYAAVQTGRAITEMARGFEEIGTQIVLVVGDRVEAFAAAAAGHIAGRVVAHVHGGDRALGVVDDSLRHAITKLAHVHFPATRKSAGRIRKLGEDAWRIHRVGSPGLDGIKAQAAASSQLLERFPHLHRYRYALLALHPETADAGVEGRKARTILAAMRDTGFDAIVVIYPNNDPGSAGIAGTWEAEAREHRPRSATTGSSARTDIEFCRDLPRSSFLALLRDAALLVGNSSAGIIEAASFGTPVIDVGRRQEGRERSRNVIHVVYRRETIQNALIRIWNDGRPQRSGAMNVYGGGGAAHRIADALARLDVKQFGRKLIAF